MAVAADHMTNEAALRCRYVDSSDPQQLLTATTLAVFGFGDGAPDHLDDPRYLKVNLQPAQRNAPFEVWESSRAVSTYRRGSIAGAEDGQLCFGWRIQSEAGIGVSVAAEQTYHELIAELEGQPYRHLLRVWNYIDAITEGEDDDERYRQFCVGRAEGMLGYHGEFPAATAIGRNDGKRDVQVFWLCARDAGTALENPRQVAAYRYPRQYGPRPPSFARAMLPDETSGLPLMLSGTAAVVGHQTVHVDDLEQQFHETLRNLNTLLSEARQRNGQISDTFDQGSMVKAYVRNADDLTRIERLLAEHLPNDVPRLVLHADICRRDLLVEIDGFHDL